ncbi:hypothetical protein PIB30_025610 [Stylosanthes scabra]|uniref:Uncharacterized protein n=1 Tax=Stylosanthes scabra TaxID=79078 RepID=A0ABU6TA97_9FABA|nr:hypothetical protein [Stylosanthes scabra]
MESPFDISQNSLDIFPMLKCGLMHELRYPIGRERNIRSNVTKISSLRFWTVETVKIFGLLIPDLGLVVMARVLVSILSMGGEGRTISMSPIGIVDAAKVGD